MHSPHGYILILDPGRRHCQDNHCFDDQFNCPVYIAASPEQALAQAATAPPCLVILMGDDQQYWTQALIDQLRQTRQTPRMTIVALTNSTSPRWDYQENTPGIDGFLVKPLSNDVLNTLVESAFAKQTCGE